MEAALREAAAKGDEEDVRHYIRRRADVNATDAEGNTALHLAAKGGHSTVIVALLRADADVDAQNHLGETPLLLAARKGDLDSVRVLLKFGADRNIEDNNGRTPLFVAMSEQHSAVAAELLNGAVNVGIPATEGEEVVEKQADEQRFREAAEEGDIRTIREMIRESNVDIDATDDQNHTALYRATFYGRKHVVELLLKEGANPEIPDRSGKTPLHVAASENNVQIVSLLLRYVRSIDVRDIDGGTPIYSAAESGASSVIKPLLDAGGDVNLPNKNEETPLWVAAAHGHEGVIRRLMDETQRLNVHLDVDAAGFLRGRTPLHLAAKRGDVRIAALLLNAGAAKNIEDSSGQTPLFLAAEVGRTRMVRYLLDRGVFINAINHQGETSLYIAASNGNIPVTHVLLDQGADTDAADADGRTPLMAAAQEGHVAIVVALLKADAEIEAANDIGETPLMVAAYEGYQNTLALLIRHGANFEAIRNDGKTALHLAVRGGHVGVVNVLLSASKAKLENLKHHPSMTAPLHLTADTQGETALHLAARFRQVSAMSLLLDYDTFFHKHVNGSSIYGKLVHQQNIFGWTAMHGAVDRVHRGAVNLLLDHNADVHAADIYGNTPVHLAARGIDHRLLLDLIEAQETHVSIVNVEGRTPLHFAAACIRPSSVSVLLENGAEASAADIFKQQPLDLLGQPEACNPEQAVTIGLCNYAADRPDMCPITLGNENELIETERLLKLATGHQNRTQDCHPSCPDGLTQIRTQQRPTPSSADSVQIPVYGVIIPALALVLLVMVGVWMLFKRHQRGPVGGRRSFGFSSRRLKHKQEQMELERMESAMQYTPPLPRKNTFDAMQSILNDTADIPEASVTSGSVTSPSGSSCGWSDATDDFEAESNGQSNGEHPPNHIADHDHRGSGYDGDRGHHDVCPMDAERCMSVHDVTSVGKVPAWKRQSVSHASSSLPLASPESMFSAPSFHSHVHSSNN